MRFFYAILRPRMLTKENLTPQQELQYYDSEEFIGHINNLAGIVTKLEDYHDHHTGYISDEAWKLMIKGGILLNTFSERDINNKQKQQEILEQVRTLAHHDFDLSLTYGITHGLVANTLDSFHQSEGQRDYWKNKLKNGDRPSFGVTELNGSGSAALQMDSQYQINPDGTLDVSVSKHFQGQSLGPWMIVFAKGTRRDIGAIVVPKEDFHSDPIPTIAIPGISYARNVGTTTLNTDKHLLATISPREMTQFQDLFIRSRLTLVAMTHGHLEKVSKASHEYAQTHEIHPKLQADYEVVSDQLAYIDAQRATSQVLYDFVSNYDIPDAGQSVNHLLMEANLIKALGSEIALNVSDTRLKLLGARGYDSRHPANRDRSSILAVTIFEGPNDKLYTDIGRTLLSGVKDRQTKTTHLPSFSNLEKTTSLFHYLLMLEEYKPQFPLGNGLASLVQNNLNQLGIINSDSKLTDRDYYFLGRISAKLFALSHQDQSDLNQNERHNMNLMLNEEIAIDLLRLQARSQIK